MCSGLLRELVVQLNLIAVQANCDPAKFRHAIEKRCCVNNDRRAGFVELVRESRFRIVGNQWSIASPGLEYP